MFEFFLALFGGTYYIGRLFNEKSKSKRIDGRERSAIDELVSDSEKWVNRVVDIKLEYDTKNLPIEELEKMRQRITDEAGLSYVSDDMVFLGLLAQKAKIPKSIANTGFHSFGVWDYEEQQRWHQQRMFMLWYDKELRDHGLEEPLMFVNGINENKVKHDINVASPITSTNQVIRGRYFWAPMRFYVG